MKQLFKYRRSGWEGHLLVWVDIVWLSVLGVTIMAITYLFELRNPINI